LLPATAYDEYIEPLRQLCLAASTAIVSHYDSSSADDHDLKHDASPLTAADLASHEILESGLAGTGLPLLSEESAPEVREQTCNWPRYWLVDPLDGTKEFLGRTGDFTINIALIENRRAVFGIIAVPLTQTVYLGIPGAGAWMCSGIAADWVSIACRPLPRTGGARVLTSRRHRGERLDRCLAQVQDELGALERDYIGSALKFCQLAVGEADFYPRFSPCSEWDTAAGQALLEGAGGLLIDLEGKALLYNRGESLLNPHFFAIADPTASIWKSLLKRGSWHNHCAN
jgi:3'(2'), 5'-bisphosphate nucleotidase